MSWGQLDCEHFGECKYKPTPATCYVGCKYYKLEHYTDGRPCWCEPEVEVMENSNKVIIHKEEQ